MLLTFVVLYWGQTLSFTHHCKVFEMPLLSSAMIGAGPNGLLEMWFTTRCLLDMVLCYGSGGIDDIGFVLGAFAGGTCWRHAS